MNLKQDFAKRNFIGREANMILYDIILDMNLHFKISLVSLLKCMLWVSQKNRLPQNMFWSSEKNRT